MPAITTVQIFGFNDCPDTRKARRFFSERRIQIHYVDLDERPAAKGELRRFGEKFGAAALIDRESRRFRDLGLHVRGDSPERMLDRALSEPRILKTPLVRAGNRVSVGHAPQEWQRWLDETRAAPS
jgi:arsenate reductase-like glutaredoxin family protein